MVHFKIIIELSHAVFMTLQPHHALICLKLAVQESEENGISAILLQEISHAACLSTAKSTVNWIHIELQILQ